MNLSCTMWGVINCKLSKIDTISKLNRARELVLWVAGIATLPLRTVLLNQSGGSSYAWYKCVKCAWASQTHLVWGQLKIYWLYFEINCCETMSQLSESQILRPFFEEGEDFTMDVPAKSESDNESDHFSTQRSQCWHMMMMFHFRNSVNPMLLNSTLAKMGN